MPDTINISSHSIKEITSFVTIPTLNRLIVKYC